MSITVRPLTNSDLPAAHSIFRAAFGTFLGLPDPQAFAADMDYVGTRWVADPNSVFVAEIDGELAGSNVATRWGSVGFFGPLTIRPDLWDRGIGKRLMEPVMACFDAWGVRHAGLFTFAHSAKHVGLYAKFGFWPRFLTAIMAKPVEATAPGSGWTKYSEVPTERREECLKACRELSGGIYEGLDLGREIRAADEQGLGETVLVWGNGKLEGFAVCHCGAGTEAGAGQCYVKFGAARGGESAEKRFEELLNACEALAAERGLARIAAGVNLSREGACRRMLERGFRTYIQGVTMHRPNAPGYSRPDVYVMDDWR